MSGHRISAVTVQYDNITITLACDEPITSPCRWLCDLCESWSGLEVDEAAGTARHPITLYDGYTDLAGTETWHDLHLSPCGGVKWAMECGAVQESCGHETPVPLRPGPIDLVWDGDNYLWTYAREATS